MSKPNMKKLVNPQDSIFEQIKHVDENGAEYWSARDMAKVLEYSEYRHFKQVVDKAKEACANSQYKVQDHFEDILEMVEMGKVRKTIEELGGTMPEDLPVADSIKRLESKEQRLLKDKKEERGE